MVLTRKYPHRQERTGAALFQGTEERRRNKFHAHAGLARVEWGVATGSLIHSDGEYGGARVDLANEAV